MEWNWDWAWWKSPRRVVQPTKPDQPRHEDQGQASVEPTSSDAPKAKVVDEGPSDTTRELMRSRQDSRPFRQLYLVSSDSSASVERGDSKIHLQHARARPCAMMLEMLCVPLGRSGNPDECYLLYEVRREFEAAERLAPLLDVPAISTSPSTADSEGAFRAGVGLMLTVVDRGVVVEKSLIDEAEKRLSEALHAEPLAQDKRWAAGILASRLMCEYRYDYDAARLYAMQAERLAPVGTLGQFTAQYWRADALVQAGKPSDANAIYQDIAHLYGPSGARSQLLRQGKGGATESKKK